MDVNTVCSTDSPKTYEHHSESTNMIPTTNRGENQPDTKTLTDIRNSLLATTSTKTDRSENQPVTMPPKAIGGKVYFITLCRQVNK